MDAAAEASALIAKIRDLRGTLERLAGPFRTDDADRSFDRFSPDHWRRNTYGNALVRLRLITENNFAYIETLGLLAVARYIFELSVWLRLIEKDVRYALVFYSELLETQRRYYEDTLEHFKREVELLKKLAAMDSDASAGVVARATEDRSAAGYGELLGKAMARVDAEASRHFSIFAEDAKVNGYGFQAYLVEKKKFPEALGAIEQIGKEIENLRNLVSGDVKALMPQRWQWRAMAKKAGIEDEHDYIYSYASKLLHATPASLHTDQKNLEMQEVYLFLRYIYVKILEICDMAYAQPECKLKKVP